MATSNTVTIGTATTLIVEANPQRLSLIISVVGAGGLFLGETASMDSSTGILIPGGGGSYAEDSGGQRTYLGPYYGVTSSGTTDIRYWERERK